MYSVLYSSYVERYTARYRRSESGWTVTAGGVSAHGRTLEKARIAIASALAKHLGTHADHIPIDDDIDLGGAARKALRVARAARSKALEANAASNAATRRAARDLVDDGLSYRDAAHLLGLSHSRIQQLLPDEQEETA